MMKTVYAPCTEDAKKSKPKVSPWQKLWWKKRSHLEVSLLVLFLISVLVAAALVIVIVIQATLKQESETCETEGCIVSAARILKNMDRSIDPCQDFYEYACGRWKLHNPIPDDSSRTSSFWALGRQVNADVRQFLEEPVESSEPEAVRKAKSLYRSCVDTEKIEKLGITPLWQFLDKTGGWPVVNRTWSEHNLDMMSIFVMLRLYNIEVFFAHLVDHDWKHSHLYIHRFDEANLGMPSRGYFLKGRNDTMLQAYEKYAYDVAVALGATETDARQQIKQMVDFEVDIANIMIPEEKKRDFSELYNRMTLKQMTRNITGIDWTVYLRTIFQHVNLEIPDSEPVIVSVPGYYREIFDLMQRTPKRTIVNYLTWRVIQYAIAFLPKRYRSISNAYRQVVYGSKTEQARWKTCVKQVTYEMGDAVGRVYVQKRFDEEAKVYATEMITNIKESFKEMLAENEWMDDVTKRAAMEKAEATVAKVAYPDFILNDTALDEKYKHMTCIPGQYFYSVLENKKAKTFEKLKKLRTVLNKTEWQTNQPAMVNAFYHPICNQIIFPAGILQPPFFEKDFPQYLNYGGIGSIVGHEITHGFDDEGRQTDKDGNLIPWWQPSAVEKFKRKAQCIIDQYSKYVVKEVNMTVNGIRTQGENIADNGGLKEAYRAYHTWVKKRGQKEKPLPGLNMTVDQIFFINYAQNDCGNMTPESYIEAIQSWVHTPNRYRIIGTVSNFPAFARSFNCPLRSPMNPRIKCNVW
ncbi:neprilysin-4-like [Lineus longissimus]|uniref:neprilysin-4-like n=1 Tax=Lineus longissimus TaxID=88925 RepID=UPI002B4C4C58